MLALTKKAKVDLAYLAGCHIVVKRYQKTAEVSRHRPKGDMKLDCVKQWLPLAEDILSDVDAYHEPPSIADPVKRTFSAYARSASSINFGTYLNRVAIVYVFVILEAFLRKAYRTRSGGLDISKDSGGFGTLLSILSGKQGVPRETKTDPRHFKLRGMERLVPRPLTALKRKRDKVVHSPWRRFSVAIDTEFVPGLEAAFVFVDRATTAILDDKKVLDR